MISRHIFKSDPPAPQLTGNASANAELTGITVDCCCCLASSNTYTSYSTSWISLDLFLDFTGRFISSEVSFHQHGVKPIKLQNAKDQFSGRISFLKRKMCKKVILIVMVSVRRDREHVQLRVSHLPGPGTIPFDVLLLVFFWCSSRCGSGKEEKSFVSVCPRHHLL